MADNAVATREISRTWNELDWAWILKHWRNYSVCDGNLQNCPSLPRRAQLSDRRTLVERLFSVFHPEGNFHGEVLRISKKRSWHTLHQLSRSDRFYKITTYRLSEVENITRNFRIFFFSFFLTNESDTFFAERVIDSRIEIHWPGFYQSENECWKWYERVNNL